MIRSFSFPQTKTALIRSLGDGVEASSWREFFDRYAPAIYNVAIQSGIQPSDAEDIVQLVMITIAHYIAGFQFDKDRGRFRTWVRKITRNAIIDLQRSKRPALSIDDVPNDLSLLDNSSADALWAEEWRMQDLEYCIEQIAARITPTRMAAFRRYVLEGVSAEDTAKQLNLTVGHVYSIRFQVMKMIREEMSRLNGAAPE